MSSMSSKRVFNTNDSARKEHSALGILLAPLSDAWEDAKWLFTRSHPSLTLRWNGACSSFREETCNGKTHNIEKEG